MGEVALQTGTEAQDTVRRLPVTETTDRVRARHFPIPSDLHVCIPVKNADGGIATTLRYVSRYLPPDRVHVMINGTTDNTEQVARSTGLATVYKQNDVFRHAADVMEQMASYGLSFDRLVGKGAAMFALMLVLEELGIRPDAPIVFIDAEMSNIDAFDPIGHLLAGWEAWGSDPKFQMVKLAVPDVDVRRIMAFVGSCPGAAEIGAFQFPVCGQVCVRWGALRSWRTSTGFSIEVAHIIAALQDHEMDVSIFGEVMVPEGINDADHPDRRYVIMLAQIYRFLMALATSGYSLRALPVERLRLINEITGSRMYVPTEDNASTELLEVRNDGIIPSLAELLDG